MKQEGEGPPSLHLFIPLKFLHFTLQTIKHK